MTNNEKTVYNAMIDLIADEPWIELFDLVRVTDYSLASLKGITGNLVKKGLAYAGQEQEPNTTKNIDVLYPIHQGDIIQGFACDEYDENELEKMKI